MSEVDFDRLLIGVVIEVLFKYGELVDPIIIKPEELKRRSNGFLKTIISGENSLYSSTSTP
ncbi:hypothetical protein [Thermococcus sp.]|uniref:hypothetical protein n=1 Tax=Thermococcus sp. TaxID=35749 RepID=UPI00262B0295|nr:hypothetical protein [Thermococcus sp.]